VNVIGLIERLVAATFRRGRAKGVGERPDPSKPEGTDCLPQIGHIVVLMMENHSFDNYLGMLGRGDGFPLDAGGSPTSANVTQAGAPVRAFHLLTTTQQQHVPSQSWEASKEQFGEGRNDGFVTCSEHLGLAGDPKVAMGYWKERDLPFYSALARTFPLADRWFGSCLGPTIPNRRFLIAGTANGLTTDAIADLLDKPSGTIFDMLNRNGISWANYHVSQELHLFKIRWARLRSDLQSMVQFTADTYPFDLLGYWGHARTIGRFFSHARTGRLPAISIVDPNYETDSEENPHDIQNGEAFAAKVINAVMAGPGWPRTVLIWCYDEHGGYYDHVPPPAAAEPDDVRPRTAPEDRYDRLGFRVPAVIVSPFAKPNYVSSVVHDHTSVLKLIETKWNLPPLTHRDAAADNLLDSLDLVGPPAFAVPPTLAPPALPIL
jgi:phospholipase C